MSPVRGPTAAVLALAVLLAACAFSDRMPRPQASGPDIPRATPSGNATATSDQAAGAIPTAPTGPIISGTPVGGDASDPEFRLTIEADQGRYRAGQLITVASTLMYVGPNAGITVGGSGGGLVGFAVERADPALQILPAFTADCKPYQITSGIALDYAFSKSGGWDETNPLAPFYRAYFASPELRLPAGTWTITAQASFNDGVECRGRSHNLNAGVTLTVEP